MKLSVARQWVGAVYAEDLDLVREMLAEDPSLADSAHPEFDDPFRLDRYPVPTLLFAVNGPPPQQLGWRDVEREINLDLVKRLVDAGADTNIDSGHGLPLCYVRDRAMAEYLIAHGADINRWTDGGGAPVFFSVWNGDPGRLELQLELGADAGGCDPRTGETALHAAALAIPETAESEEGLLEVARLLLGAGVDPNARTKMDVESFALEGGPPLSEDTPLHLAAAFNTRPLVELLVDSGADPKLTNARGETPADLAKRHHRPPEVLELLG